jgi:hypothetical protein
MALIQIDKLLYNLDKVSYTIKGLEIFGIVITTRKQLEDCNMKLEVSIV